MLRIPTMFEKLHFLDLKGSTHRPHCPELLQVIKLLVRTAKTARDCLDSDCCGWGSPGDSALAPCQSSDKVVCALIK